MVDGVGVAVVVVALEEVVEVSVGLPLAQADTAVITAIASTAAIMRLAFIISGSPLISIT